MNRLKKLETQACLSLFNNKTLSEVIKFVEDEQNINITNIYGDSHDFWKAIIDKFYGPLFLQQRKDIDEKDMKILAYSLNDDVRISYGIIFNTQAPERLVIGPIQDEDDDQSLERPGGALLDDWPIIFKLQGLVPEPGSKGYIGLYRFVVDAQEEVQKTIFFLGKPDDILNDIGTDFKTYIGLLAYNDLALTEAKSYDFAGSLDNRLYTTDQELSKNSFIEFIVGYKLLKAPLLSEIFISDTFHGDSYVQIWVAEIIF